MIKIEVQLPLQLGGWVDVWLNNWRGMRISIQVVVEIEVEVKLKLS